ncbi:MAG: hypothetical protein PVG79_04220 [Gemmatimonadales bacterium]|jgi:hypothetical protein
MIRKVLSLVLMLLAAGGPALAQTDAAAGVNVGDRVRVRAQTLYGPLVGAVTALSADTLHIQIEQQATTVAIPLAAVTRIEVSRGRKSNFLRGVALGGVVGALAGVFAGFITGEDSMLTPPEAALACGTVGAGAGALVGGIIGAATGTDRWVAVPLDRLAVHVSPRHDGGVTLSLAYGF